MKITDLLPTVLVLVIVGSFLVQAWPVPKDATEPENGRSGLRLYIDSGTGCEYLGGGSSGAVTPRLDSSGKPICLSRLDKPAAR